MSQAVNQVNFLNWWSLAHFCFWLVVGLWAGARRPGNLTLGKLLLLSLAGAFLWEVIELFIARIPALWPLSESWVNRWISDPLMALLAVPLAWWMTRGARRHPGDHHRGERRVLRERHV